MRWLFSYLELVHIQLHIRLLGLQRGVFSKHMWVFFLYIIAYILCYNTWIEGDMLSLQIFNLGFSIPTTHNERQHWHQEGKLVLVILFLGNFWITKVKSRAMHFITNIVQDSVVHDSNYEKKIAFCCVKYR